MINDFRFRQTPTYPMIARATLVSTIAAISLVSGLVPAMIAPSLQLGFHATAYAQTSDPQIRNYARAAFEIEQRRQRDYADAKRIMGGNVPGDVCRQQDIPSPVRDICNSFMSDSSEIIKKHGLTNAQFNDITRRKDSDPALQQQIQNELLQLQKGAPQ